MTERTAKFKKLYIASTIVSFILTFAPIIYFSIKAFLTTGLLESKMALSGSILVVIMGTIICLLKEHKPRSLTWLILVALWLILDNLVGIILTFTITQVLDEFIVSPIQKHSKLTYKINKEINK